LWRAILIEDFGHGAVAFPGQTILVDARFVRKLQLNDHELALILSHEAAHVLAGHAAAKLSFMAEVLGKEKLPDARAALMEFMATDSYAAVFLPIARLHEREADTLGAAIFFASGYDSQQALLLFDKLAGLETHNAARDADAHDAAMVRKQRVSQVFGELQRIHALGSPRPR
jgi:predicted Zn-dependent protease